MKVAANAMIAVTNESLAETLVLAEQFGIERERAYDVLASGVLASPFVLYKRGAFLHADTEPVAFTTSLMGKDVSLARDLAANLGFAYRPRRRQLMCSKRRNATVSPMRTSRR